jgi:hypothetical protein
MVERTLTADTALLSAATADAAFTLRVIQSSAAKKQAVAANIATLIQAANFAAFRSAGGIAASGANTDITSLAGTATNDNAAAGKIGEILESTVLVGSAVSLTTATETNITSLALTAGDWDAWALASYLPNGATTFTGLTAWIHNVSATFPTVPNGGAYVSQVGGMSTGGSQHLPVGMRRYSFASTTTIYLTTYAGFGVNTLVAYGYLGARRVR